MKLEEIKISDLAPDIQNYLKGAQEACANVEKQYKECESVDKKLDFLFELVKALLMAPAIKEAAEAHKWDELLEKQRRTNG